MFIARALLAIFCGALLSLAYPPLGLWPFILALAPLILLVVNSETPVQGFLAGFFFGVGFFSLHLLWLPESFASYSGGYFWFLYPPLILILGVFWGLVSFLARRLGGRGVGALWLLPAFWLLMEWLRGQGPFAFPWGSLGYIWTNTPLAQVADLFGVYGVSLLTLCVLSLLVSPWAFHPYGRYNPRFSVAAAAILLLSWWGYGIMRQATLPFVATKTALLVQGSTDPFERAKSLDPVEAEIALYERLSREGIARLGRHPDVVVWPEGVIMDGTIGMGMGREQAVQASVGGTPLITGGASYDDDGNDFNSVYSLAHGKLVTRYDKRYLVPFGEYFPGAKVFRPVYEMVFAWFGLGFGQSGRVGEVTRPLRVNNGKAGAYICYESVFPQIARGMVAKGANYLVNISNDAWFGQGSGVWQHFYMGNMRAIETRRYLLRAGNNGVTALVNPLGKVERLLERNARDSLVVSFGEGSGKTPYVRFGDLLILWLLLYAVAVIFIRQRVLGEKAFA